MKKLLMSIGGLLLMFLIYYPIFVIYKICDFFKSLFDLNDFLEHCEYFAKKVVIFRIKLVNKVKNVK